MAAREEIEKLKTSWMEDPYWDIEDTEGFEEHYEELLAFRQEADAERTKRMEERIAKRAQVVLVETGISKQSVAQEVLTYEQIERAVADQDKYIGLCGTRFEIIQLELMQAQIRAMLLQAAQMQRIADALEERNGSDEGESHQDFMTRLYKVE